MSEGILVVNLGSPKSPEISDIKSYLKEFLMDPYVLTIPKPLRFALVYGLILPFRPKKTTHAYQSIWTEDGSPLITNTLKFAQKLKSYTQLPVEIGMRYGEPSLTQGLQKLKDLQIKKVHVVLMYPQYALSSTATAKQKILDLNADFCFELNFIQDFYGESEFIESLAEITQTHLPPNTHLLMSFHGLPWSHLGKSVGSTECKKQHCCDAVTDKNKHCYRAQSFETARQLASHLKLPRESWSLGFQSRLTRGWIEPFTDVVTRDLCSRGIKKLAVVCPSFTADCLETLEEIQIREKEAFLSYGGESFTYIPCLNDSNRFAKFIANQISNGHHHRGTLER